MENSNSQKPKISKRCDTMEGSSGSTEWRSVKTHRGGIFQGFFFFLSLPWLSLVVTQEPNIHQSKAFCGHNLFLDEDLPNTCPEYMGPLRHLSSGCSISWFKQKTINIQKQTLLCLGSWVILEPRTWVLFTPAVHRRLTQSQTLSFIFHFLYGYSGNAVFLSESAIIKRVFSCFHRFASYFPMQKSLKMMSRISSAPTRPVIRPKLVRAKRTPSAARARSASRYRRYWARAATHCCKWALWRAWVREGAPHRGSPHLGRVLQNEWYFWMLQSWQLTSESTS